jgi:hypothetical protein
MASNITGRLLNARRVRVGPHQVLVADVYEDIHGRFQDGQVITTSFITSEDGAVFCTRNSIYEVESWAVGQEGEP